MIEFQSVNFGYLEKPLLFSGLDWRVQRGERWAILGPSGCGKTTLLYLLAYLRQPLSGQVLVDGEVWLKPRPSTGLILQDYGLLPWATVLQNISLGLRIRKFYGPDGIHAPRNEVVGEVERRAQEWLGRVGLIGYADQYPGQLSGGQRQRVAIARTLALHPDLLLMDEPFSSLDATTRQDLRSLVWDLAEASGMTTIIVTHSVEDAVVLGRKIAVLHNPPQRSFSVIENEHFEAGKEQANPALLARLREELDGEK